MAKNYRTLKLLQYMISLIPKSQSYTLQCIICDIYMYIHTYTHSFRIYYFSSFSCTPSPCRHSPISPKISRWTTRRLWKFWTSSSSFIKFGQCAITAWSVQGERVLYSIKNPDKCSCYTCQYMQLTLIVLAVEITSMECAVNIVTKAL